MPTVAGKHRYEVTFRNGGTADFEVRLVPNQREDGSVSGYYAVATDISVRKRAEEHAQRLSLYDPLTNLPNRAQFVLMLDAALLEARKREHAVFVLMMDLDRFKHVNDVLGHSFGDDLLCQVAERLRQRMAQVYPAAQLARLGGDEFAVLLPDCTLAEAQQIAAGVLASAPAPVLARTWPVVAVAGTPDRNACPMGPTPAPVMGALSTADSVAPGSAKPYRRFRCGWPVSALSRNLNRSSRSSISFTALEITA